MERPDKAKALERLRRALHKAEELKNTHRDFPEFYKWHRRTKLAISRVFGENSSHVQEFTRISFRPRIIIHDDNNEAYRTGLQTSCSLLESMIEEIEEYWEDGNQETTSPSVHGDKQTKANEVFVIHGRDNESKVTIARFLEHLGLKPVILHEQSNRGRTIIEKFEQHAQVGFAVALLTPDDVGALRENTKNLKPRARQNVIFEFGYFIGRLGRNRVCALTKVDVEIPSDYEGVVYIPLDEAEGWKMKLVKELKGVGIVVDADRAF